MHEKFKFFLANDQYFYGCLVIIVGLLSFILGQLSVNQVKEESSANKILIEKPDKIDETNSKISAGELNQPIIASKSGTKYHLISCPGANQIKKENRITFASVEEARAAGYTPAGNCPGLQ